MAALKAIVIIMGLMILAGLTLLGAIIAGRLVHRAPTAPAAPTAMSFQAAPVDLPAGAQIESINTGTDRLVLVVALPGGERRLIVIDLATGRQLGTIPVRTAH